MSTALGALGDPGHPSEGQGQAQAVRRGGAGASFRQERRALHAEARDYVRRFESNSSFRLTLPASIAKAKKCAVALLNDAGIGIGDLGCYIYAGGIGVALGSIYDAQLTIGLYALIKHIFDLTGMIVQVAVFDITHCETKDCKGDVSRAIQDIQLAIAEEFARFSVAELGLGVRGAPPCFF